MKNHKLIKLGILTSSALVLGLGQASVQADTVSTSQPNAEPKPKMFGDKVTKDIADAFDINPAKPAVGQPESTITIPPVDPNNTGTLNPQFPGESISKDESSESTALTTIVAPGTDLAEEEARKQAELNKKYNVDPTNRLPESKLPFYNPEPLAISEVLPPITDEKELAEKAAMDMAYSAGAAETLELSKAIAYRADKMSFAALGIDLDKFINEPIPGAPPEARRVYTSLSTVTNYELHPHYLDSERVKEYGYTNNSIIKKETSEDIQRIYSMWDYVKGELNTKNSLGKLVAPKIKGYTFSHVVKEAADHPDINPDPEVVTVSYEAAYALRGSGYRNGKGDNVFHYYFIYNKDEVAQEIPAPKAEESQPTPQNTSQTAPTRPDKKTVNNTTPSVESAKPVESEKSKSDENQQPLKFRVHYWDDSFGANGLPTYTDIQASKEIYLQPGQSVTEVAPDIPGYTLATNIEGNTSSITLEYDKVSEFPGTAGAGLDGDDTPRLGFHYKKIDIEKSIEVQPEKPAESVKQPEPFDYIEYGIEDGGHQVELFRERRYIQPGEVLTITPTPKEGYTLKDARPITVRYTEAKQMRNQYSQFNPDYTAASYAVTYLKNGANIPKQPELKYEYYDEAKAKELLESYEYKRKLVERALEIDPDDYTPESYWKTYTGTSEDVTFSNGNFRTEIILLDTSHSLEQPLSEMKALAPAHYDYLIKYNKATASIIKQSLDGLVPIKKKEEAKPATPVQPQVETRRIHVVYQDITKLYTFGDGKDIELSPGQSYTVVIPEIEGYQADSFDFADSYFWTYAGLKNREEHYTRGLTSLTLNYDDIAPVTEDGRVHNPILYMQYRPVNTETDKTTTPVKPIQPEIPVEKPSTPVQPAGRTILISSYGVNGEKVTSFVNNNEAYITPESPYIVNQPEIDGWERGDIILVNPDGSEKKVINGSLITYENLYHEGHAIYDGGLKYTYKRSTKQKPQEEPSKPTETPVVPIKPTVPETPTSPTNQDNRVLSNVDGSVRVHGSETTLKDVSYIKVEEVVANPLSSKDYKAFDIHLYDASGKAIQPKGMVVVSVQADKPVENVYYVAADGNLQELDFTQEGNRVSFKTNHFSVYALAFRKLEAHRNGEETVRREQLTTPTVPVSNHSVKVDNDNEETKVTSLPANQNSDAKSLPNTGETQSSLGILGFILALFGLAGWTYKGRHERGR